MNKSPKIFGEMRSDLRHFWQRAADWSDLLLAVVDPGELKTAHLDEVQKEKTEQSGSWEK